MATTPMVLVPGGFLGPWVWEGVRSRLDTAGVAAHRVALASVPQDDDRAAGDLHDDAAAVRAVLDRLDVPAVVCGHSYGGAVITQAAAGPHPGVARLVYLAAAAPDAGQSLADLAPPPPPPAGEADGDAAAEQVRVHPDGTIQLLPESAIASLFHDCGEQAAATAAGLLRPMNPAVNSQAVTAAAWRQAPASYVRCTDDRLPELLAEEFLDVVDDVVELPTGHCPQWSRPELVAELLLGHAR